MSDEISYQAALEKVALLEDHTTLDVKLTPFDKSLLLAVLFDKDKKATMDDIVRVRLLDKAKGSPYEVRD